MGSTLGVALLGSFAAGGMGPHTRAASPWPQQWEAPSFSQALRWRSPCRAHIPAIPRNANDCTSCCIE